jgi:gamma-glutamyl:cysteine ligase YbdK (ATP-grasp superfamily)
MSACTRYGTVQIRIMDAQTTVEDVAVLSALVQSLARLELERSDGSEEPPAGELIAKTAPWQRATACRRS